MNSEYVTSTEAGAVIAKWASRGTQVIFVEELGDLAVFVQRRGEVSLARPGVPVHTSGEMATTIFPGRFAEVVHLQDDSYEAIFLRRPVGAVGIEISLIADWTGDLQPDDILLLVQAARVVRPPVQ